MRLQWTCLKRAWQQSLHTRRCPRPCCRYAAQHQIVAVLSMSFLPHKLLIHYMRVAHKPEHSAAIAQPHAASRRNRETLRTLSRVIPPVLTVWQCFADQSEAHLGQPGLLQQATAPPPQRTRTASQAASQLVQRHPGSAIPLPPSPAHPSTCTQCSSATKGSAAAGEKLIDHLKKWLEPEKLLAVQHSWDPGQECQIAAAILDLFHLLPPPAVKFLETQASPSLLGTCLAGMMAAVE